MIITITGAYRNVGDHLIKDRAHKLLKKYVDADIIDIPRNKLKGTDLNLLNKAKTIYLCGGPAYQTNMFPKIYNIELDRITTKIVPFGLGNKSFDESNFVKFSNESLNFIKKIHEKIDHSSVRGVITQENLSFHNVKNVIMTGCPAWYNLELIHDEFKFSKKSSIKTIIYSAPALTDKSSLKVMEYISNKFKKCKGGGGVRMICTLHHGNIVGYRPKAMLKNYGVVKTKFVAKKMGFEVLDLNSDVNKIKIYDQSDLHIGYRVHAHIYMLSNKLPSFLISEDSRGIDQSKTLGSPILTSNSKHLIEEIDSSLNTYFSNQGSSVAKQIRKMQETYSVMMDYLSTSH